MSQIYSASGTITGIRGTGTRTAVLIIALVVIGVAATLVVNRSGSNEPDNEPSGQIELTRLPFDSKGFTLIDDLTVAGEVVVAAASSRSALNNPAPARLAIWHTTDALSFEEAAIENPDLAYADFFDFGVSLVARDDNGENLFAATGPTTDVKDMLVWTSVSGGEWTLAHKQRSLVGDGMGLLISGPELVGVTNRGLGESRVLTSKDGTLWRRSAGTLGAKAVSAAYAEGMYTVSTETGGVISSNGIVWRSAPFVPSNALLGSDGHNLVAARLERDALGKPAIKLTSIDLELLTTSSLDVHPEGNHVTAIAVDGPRLLIAADGRPGHTHLLIWDGSTSSRHELVGVVTSAAPFGQSSWLIGGGDQAGAAVWKLDE